ncbi:uncharacterized protein containing a Zn-finger-like domain [Thioflavicoccus mobilis 8321]|uniref:Uncharacterized protein containing a Zn-finger-like domain n=1 Tax=Thioflavicoccus mobilis 8321 TaxID=765912 RepID=L0GVM3_9GAMM|nr:cysteine-rich small domain-containing protein [Thioflavicoccus mobilis]AGA89349.1 uncharacterized protein containing a Zn-finger-like domain [Thioflavicoccus mobilis 8321]
MEPKDKSSDRGYEGFTNTACPFLPCHRNVRHTFNCLFCYCPLIAYVCPGPYRLFTDKHGLVRKDCTACTLPHEGYHASWQFIQTWLERPIPWDGRPADPRAANAERLAQHTPPDRN